LKVLSINIPETLDLNEKEVKIVLAAKLFEMGKLSLGQAAELSDYSKRTFMELLSNYGVSIFNSDEAQLEKDTENAAISNE